MKKQFVFLTVLLSLFLWRHDARADVIVADPGPDGIQQRALVRIDTPGTTLTSSSTASPFARRPFGTSTASRLLDDASGTSQAYAAWADSGQWAGTPTTLIQPTDWVLIQFDISFTGTNWQAGEMWAGNPGGAAIKFGINGGNLAVQGRQDADAPALTWIPIPNVTPLQNEWYHVDIVAMPYSFGSTTMRSNDRTYAITVTQYAAGTLLKGSLQHVLYDFSPWRAQCSYTLAGGSCPMTEMGFGNLETGTSIHGVRFDNLSIETLAGPGPVVNDGCNEDQSNPLAKVGSDGTYGYVTTPLSPLATNRFPNNFTSGDLNDSTNAAAPRLKQTTSPMGMTGKDWVHAQFDFKFNSSANADEWSFIFADSSALPSQGSSGSPNAFELRPQPVGGNKQLALYGRSNTTQSLSYLLTGVPVDSTSWYRVDVLFRPAYLAGNERTYTVGITRVTGGGVSSFKSMTLLNEDSGVITDFNVLTRLTTKTGHVYVDNVLIEPLRNTTAELRYGYYPSAHGFRAFPKTLPYWVSNWTYDLVVAASESSVKTWTPANFPGISYVNPFPLGGESLTGTPGLTDGTTYKFRMILSSGFIGDANVILEKTFTHHVFPWENSTLGTDDTVIVPPFTPLVTNTGAATVDSVLRTHTVNGAGLWSQVASQGVSLLSGPMTLNAVIAGNSYSTSGSSVNFTSTLGHRVTGTGSWGLGPLTSRTSNFDFDYDGLTKVTLNLGSVPTNVTSVYIDIPMVDAQAKYMKVVTELTPAANQPGHLAQNIPAGTGNIWNSANAWRTDLPGQFVPYIWVGGAERGILFMAENAKGWSLDDTTPTMELIRNGGTLTLRVKFFTKALSAPSTRTINFALMATPAKPMPTTPTSWRNWRFALPNLHADTERRLTHTPLLDSTFDHGAQSESMAFYPAFKNYSIFDEYVKTRDTGLANPNYPLDRLNSLFTASQYYGNPYGDAADDEFCDPGEPCIRNAMGRSVRYGMLVAALSRNAAPLSDLVKDDCEGNPPIPLIFDSGGDPANTYDDKFTGSASKFQSQEFPALSTKSGLMTDNSASKTPYLYKTGFGLTSNDGVRVAFDVKLDGSAPWQWDYLVGDSYSGPFAAAVGVQGTQFKVHGRRKISDALGTIYVPNVSYATDTWYHIEIVLRPPSTPAADRTYSVHVAQQNTDGSWTTGALKGILNEDTGPLDGFWIRNATYGSSGTGTLTVDNVVVSRAKPTLLYTYTNARGMVWDKDTFNETYTYLDEWSIYDPADPRWDDAIGVSGHFLKKMLRENAAGYDEFTGTTYEAEPVASYVDAALYHLAKMYDTYLDGIYFDDWYMRANYNPLTGPGYVGDDGKLYPGVPFYNYRAFAKRNMILQYQRGLRPATWIHMTNNNIIPVLSFGTINFDWEWYGPGPGASPVIDRQTSIHLDADATAGKDIGFVMAEATGFQSGNLGVMIDWNYYCDEQTMSCTQAHLRKSQLAIALVHETKVADWQKEAEDADKALENFGYGLADCAVYRYWDGSQPVTANTNNVKLLVLSRPNKAFIVVSGFGDTPASIKLTVNTYLLGLPGGWQAYDDTDPSHPDPITVNGNQFDVPNFVKNEFRLIRLE